MKPSKTRKSRDWLENGELVWGPRRFLDGTEGRRLLRVEYLHGDFSRDAKDPTFGHAMYGVRDVADGIGYCVCDKYLERPRKDEVTTEAVRQHIEKIRADDAGRKSCSV